MSDERPDELLIEAALGAHRERDDDGLPRTHGAWRDLTPEGREECFRRQLEARALERALDPRGWNATVRAVMARIG
jgi:hypothetical protein